MYYGTGTGCCAGQYSQMPYYPYYGITTTLLLMQSF